MGGRNWHKGWHGRDDHDHWRDHQDGRSESHHGFGHRHHKAAHRDDEGDVRHRKCWDDHRHDEKDAPSHARSEGDFGRGDHGQESLPAVSEPQPIANELGWGDAAWAEAGGFEAVLLGHLFGGSLPGGAGSPVILISIDQLDIDFNTLIQNINQSTQIQNTQIVFNALDGGSVDVAGDVTAVSSQQSLVDQSGGLPGIPDLA